MATRTKATLKANRPSTPVLKPHPQRLLDLGDQVTREYALLQSSLKTAALRRWAAELPARLRPAAHRLWVGSIVWPRQLAQPDVSATHLAFVIDHLRPQEFLSYEQGEGFDWVKIAAPYAVRPASWDGPSDAQTLRVSFAVLLGDEPGQSVRVRPADGVRWLRPDGAAVGEVRIVPSRLSLTVGSTPRSLPPMRIAVR
jgi:hypothetical protein